MSHRRLPTLKLFATDSGYSTPSRDSGIEVQTWPDLYGEVFARCYLQGDEHWIELPELSVFRFSHREEEVTAFFPSRVPAQLVREAYWHSVLPMVLQAQGTEVLHASGVLTPLGVVALCGKSCSGKSTVAYALGQRGYRLWADDAVAFETSEQIVTTPLPFNIRLRPRSQAYFGTQSSGAGTAGGSSLAEHRDKDSVALAALYILKRASSGPLIEICPLSEPEAFAALLSHAYCFSLHDRERKRQMMHHYLDLTVKIPVFEVRYRPDLRRISSVLDGIESSVDALCRESNALVTRS